MAAGMGELGERFIRTSHGASSTGVKPGGAVIGCCSVLLRSGMAPSNLIALHGCDQFAFCL